MKKIFLICLLLLLLLNIKIYADYEIKTVYFQPNNVDNVPVEKIRGWMNDVQELYAEEMSQNGYGKQTFKLEREHNGNVKVNVVNGAHPSWKYQSNTWENIKAELDANWKNYQKNIHVFIIGGINTVNTHGACCTWGVGWPITNFNFGGACFVAENANTSLVRLIAHEIGHTLSLYHTGTSNTIMGSGLELLEYEARWLHKHYFFNANRIITRQYAKVNRVYDIKEIENNIISIKINITSPNDLYQVVVMDNNILVLSSKNIDTKSINANIKIDRNKLIGKTQLTFMIMDIHGAFTHYTHKFIMPPRFLEQIVKEPTINQNKNENLKEEAEVIKEDVSKNVVYLNINSGKKTLPDEDGLKPFNSSHEYKNGWGWQNISDNKTNLGNPIIIRNTTFERGISLSPPKHPRVSELEYNLQGNNYIAFEGYIGIPNDYAFEIDKHENKSCFVGGSCIFTFKIDGENIYKSKLLTGKDKYEEVDFYIPLDAEVLKIVIDSSNDSEWCDHPAIGDPKLISNSQIKYSINPKGKVATLWANIKQ